MKNSMEIYNPVLPLSPYFTFSIGKDKYEFADPNYVIEFRMSRSYDTLGTFELTVSDVHDFDMEEKIIKAITDPEKNPITFQLGWAEAERSVVYKAMMWEYLPQFLSNLNMNFTMSGICESKYHNIESKEYEVLSYDELVAKVCEYEGWQLARRVKCTEYPKVKQFNQENKTSMAFLRDCAKDAKSEKDGLPIRLLHTCTSDGGSRLFMIDIDFTKPKIIKNSYNFTINSGNYGSVISFEPMYDGTATAMMGVEVNYSDENSNDIFLTKTKHANHTAINADAPVRKLANGSINESDMTAWVQNLWVNTHMMSSGYEATLTVIGDVGITPFDYINIIPMRPDGRMHHTGGTYFVTKVDDFIAPGQFTTTLSLIKIPGTTASLESVMGGNFKSSSGIQ